MQVNNQYPQYTVNLDKLPFPECNEKQSEKIETVFGYRYGLTTFWNTLFLRETPGPIFC